MQNLHEGGAAACHCSLIVIPSQMLQNSRIYYNTCVTDVLLVLVECSLIGLWERPSFVLEPGFLEESSFD